MRTTKTLAAIAAATLCATLGTATAQQPIVLQWQTANLTEKQYEPIWKATVT